MVRNMTTPLSDIVKEAIFCYEQSTPEKYKEDMHKANRYESCIYELFREMTEEELASYKQQLIDLGYVAPDHYTKKHIIK
jgi:hypothetical protein